MIYGKPHVWDHVYNSARDAEGKNPYGQIIGISRSEDEAVVKYFGSSKIRYAEPHSKDVSNWLEGGGEIEFVCLPEFAGCWSSHDGGDGEWKL